jgi:hypothetical protein
MSGPDKFEVVLYTDLGGSYALWCGPAEDWADFAHEAHIDTDGVLDQITVIGEVVETTELKWQQ